MTLAVVFRRAARAEFADAADWYERRRRGLGVEFISEVQRCVAQAAEQPEVYVVVHNATRRIITRRFPYSVYFRVDAQRFVVLAVFHGSRDPLIWKGRS